MSLDRHLTILQFQTLARVEEAHHEGAEIVGCFAKQTPLVIRDLVVLCEAFANCRPDEGEILRFTCRYSPLSVVAAPGEEFRFPVKEWVQLQERFRWSWEVSTPRELKKHKEVETWDWKEVGNIVAFEGTNFLKFTRRGVVFQAEKLRTLIDVCFGAIPLERRRVCPAPDCKKRYFVAHHLKQTFCGNRDCIEWGKRKLKLEYWERNKKRLLADRKRKRRGII